MDESKQEQVISEYSGKYPVPPVPPVPNGASTDWPPSFLARRRQRTEHLEQRDNATITQLPAAACNESTLIAATPCPEVGDMTTVEPIDWWQQMTDDARQYLARPVPDPCVWCGGHYRHNPACVALHPDWRVAMPFGKHKGKPLDEVPREYLLWLVGRLDAESPLAQDIAHTIGSTPSETETETDDGGWD